MNSHKNARTTFEGRKLLIDRIAAMALTLAAEAVGISTRTARKWLKRFEEFGPEGLLDRSSRPLSPTHRTVAPRPDAMRRIAAVVGRSVATISRVLACLVLSSLKALKPKAPVVRYVHDAPGELLHMDTKKLGRMDVTGHAPRVTRASAHEARLGVCPCGH